MFTNLLKGHRLYRLYKQNNYKNYKQRLHFRTFGKPYIHVHIIPD